MALWLSAAEGHSYAEVATILETTEKSVKALVHRGRCALVAALRAAESTTVEVSGHGAMQALGDRREAHGAHGSQGSRGTGGRKP